MGSIKQDIKDTFLGVSESAQEVWNDFYLFFAQAWPLLSLLVLILVGVWWYADPPPPRQVLMATGTTGGSYEILGKNTLSFLRKKESP